jgi:hypothetical protein
MIRDYIDPILSIQSNFDEAKEFHESGGVAAYIRQSDPPLELKDLAKAKRNLIVGEPGIGKTELLRNIEEYLKGIGYSTEFVSLRQTGCEARIDAFLKDTPHPRALLLDALDEIPSKDFPDVLKKIEEVSQDNIDLPMFLSSRWVFATKYISSFPEYRFISIDPFSREQVRDYLIRKGHPDKLVSELLERVSSFSNPTNILQVPRYLSFVNSLLVKNKSNSAPSLMSRNALFEHFIYSSLEEEDRKSGEDKGAITKRLLEKLALTMEIYQTNIITKDELMTFFDEIASDLKVVALAQFNLQKLFDRSILKVSHDSIEFDNTEFQEYLAAKEISRLSDPNRAASIFAVDQNINEIYPSWFNALSFLIDLQSDLLEPLVDFSGIRAPEFKVVDESLLTFICKVNPASLSQEVRRRLFTDVAAYHERARLWMPWGVSRALAGFYDATLEDELKAAVVRAEGQPGAYRYVPLGNAVGILSSLLDADIKIDHKFWREKLIQFASVSAENNVLQRNALHALEALGDPTVIDQLPNLLDSEQLVAQAFLSMCAAVDPDSPKSVEYFIEAIRRGDFQGRYGLFKIQSPDGIKTFLSALNTDERFRTEFLEKASIFSRGEDRVLVENIERVFDDDLNSLIKELVLISLSHEVFYNAERSEFIIGLWKLLHRRTPNFFRNIVAELGEEQKKSMGIFFFAQTFLAETIEAADVPEFLDAMIQADQEISAYQVMQKVQLSNRENSAQIYEAGRSKLPLRYKEWEDRPRHDDLPQHMKLLKEFRQLLEPEPEKYHQGVFQFFNRNFKELKPLMEANDHARLKTLLTDTVFRYIDPSKANVTITREDGSSRSFSYSTNIPLFGSGMLTASLIGLDITLYRQQIIDFIPFASGDELKKIFELVSSIRSDEMNGVLAVYKERKSDLWRHQPHNFVDAVERFHIVEAVDVLKGMVAEPAYDRYTRERALMVSDSLAPDAEYCRQLFLRYEQATDDNRKLAIVANQLLISSHVDSEAIHWRLQEIVKRSVPYTEPNGVHVVSAEAEELWGKSFAKPLMLLKCRGFESAYLDLLNDAIRLWGKGAKFHSYAQYLWEITYMYFDNLKHMQSYEPLKMLEDKVAKMQDQEGANWLAAQMVRVRRSYLAYLGRPRNISEAIKKYNVARAYDNKKITNVEDLFRQVQDALDTELRRWIEGEGAYELIRGQKVHVGKKQAYEDLIQKTLKAQVENILLRRGFQVDFIREPQLLDDRRVDILLRYGFAGPLVIEVKLTSNRDLKAADLRKSKSYANMKHYMSGYGAQHGIFLVIDNDDATNLSEIKKAFQQIPNVLVQSFDCPGVEVRSIQGRKKTTVVARSTNSRTKKTTPRIRSGNGKK